MFDFHLAFGLWGIFIAWMGWRRSNQLKEGEAPFWRLRIMSVMSCALGLAFVLSSNFFSKLARYFWG
jgi:hypothetical protein